MMKTTNKSLATNLLVIIIGVILAYRAVIYYDSLIKIMSPVDVEYKVGVFFLQFY